MWTRTSWPPSRSVRWKPAGRRDRRCIAARAVQSSWPSSRNEATQVPGLDRPGSGGGGCWSGRGPSRSVEEAGPKRLAGDPVSLALRRSAVRRHRRRWYVGAGCEAVAQVLDRGDRPGLEAVAAAARLAGTADAASTVWSCRNRSAGCGLGSEAAVSARARRRPRRRRPGRAPPRRSRRTTSLVALGEAGDVGGAWCVSGGAAATARSIRSVRLRGMVTPSRSRAARRSSHGRTRLAGCRARARSGTSRCPRSSRGRSATSLTERSS